MRFNTHSLKRLPGVVPIVAGLVVVGACKRGDSNADTTMSAITSTDSALVAGVGETTGMSAHFLTDADIFAVIEEINDSEVELGKLARDKATNADVKAFARDMVAAHEKMADEGEALAKRLNISPNSQANDSLEAANDSTEDRLEALAKGIAFDTAYLNQQVTAHEKTMSFLNRAKDQVTSAELKAWLETATPAIQTHLDRARQLRTAVK